MCFHYMAGGTTRLAAFNPGESRSPTNIHLCRRPKYSRDVPVLHTGLISCSTGTSIPPKVENPGSTSVVGSRD
jgi:hypothetical protein